MSELPHPQNPKTESKRDDSFHESAKILGETPYKSNKPPAPNNITDKTLSKISNKTQKYFGFETIEPKEPKR